MNRITFPILVLGLSLASVVCRAAEPQLKASGDDAAQLKALHAERIKLLKQLVDIYLSQYSVGTVDFNQLCSAQNELCDAQLDSMDEPEKRVALLTKQVDMANDILKIVQARFDAGSVSEADRCRAKSLHVGLKIRLLRERNSKRPPISTPPGKQP